MKCESCGEELPERARFCLNCGAPVKGVPAPKRLEEPLDPLAAGAVPMVPVAPPPRAYRVEPRLARTGARTERRMEPRPASDRPQGVGGGEQDVEKDAPSGLASSERPEPVAADADSTMTMWTEEPAQPESAPESAPDRPSPVAALARRLREMPGPKPALIAAALVALGLVTVVLVTLNTSWLGPFASRGDEAPVVQPPSDGSIPPLETDDDETDAGDDADSGELAPRESVDAYSWDELAQVSALIADAPSDEAALEIAMEYNLCLGDGTLDGTQVKRLELSDGTSVDVAVAGFRHDQRADGSGGAGITFVTLGPVGSQAYNSAGEPISWEAAPLRSWLNQSLMADLPDGLADLIVPVTKETNTPNGGRVQTDDSVWLLSATEVANLASNGDAEGEQYQLFSDLGVSGDSEELALCDDYWWLRGPSADPAWQGAVSPDGSPHSGRNTIYEFDVVAGFCL